MPGGLGPNAILPGVGDIWRNITGQKLGPHENNDPANWFGNAPMDAAARTQDYGRMGGFVSRGPQSTTYSRSGMPLGEAGGAGLQGALFGSSYDPSFGQSAYQRFQDTGDSYLRRYGTDIKADDAGNAVLPMLDAQGHQVGFGQGVAPNPAYATAKLLIESPERSAGQRSGALFGGRDATGAPIAGNDYSTHKEFAGLLALQQGVNPYLNDPRLAASMARSGETSSPFARADPSNYLSQVLRGETGPTTGDVAGGYVDQTFDQGQVSVDDMQRMASGAYGSTVGGVQGMTNAYEKSLLDQMAQQGSQDLSLGVEDARNQLSAMGLGRSGQGQSTAAGVWENIQQKNALDRQNLMAQFRQAAMEREAQTMTTMGAGAMDANARAILAQQGGGINAILAAQGAAAQGNESRLGRANQGIMQGLAAQNASYEGSRAAERGALLGGQEGTRQWNLGEQGNYLNSLQGADQAALNRMISEGNAQSQGLHDYMSLQQTKDQMRSQSLEEMLGLEDRYRTSQNEVLNQMQQFGNYPLQTLISMMTGISPTGGSPARTNPYGPLLAGAGLNYAGNVLGQMSAPSASALNSSLYGGGDMRNPQGF